jgi:hypothetical protein
LERRARERYYTLDRLDAELNWYRGQYNTLDALIEALRTPDRWLVYRAETLRDQPPELDACDNPPRKIPYYRLRPIHFGH